MQRDGSGMEDHKVTEEQERLTIYANRLYNTLGRHAADAIEADFGLPALLAEKSSIDIEQEKHDAEKGKDPKRTAVDHLFDMMGQDPENGESEDSDEQCQCPICRIQRGEKINNFKTILAMLRQDVERDLSEKVINCPVGHLPSLYIQMFYRALAMGYVLGRDEKEIASGKYDADLDKLDRINALAEIDKELLVSEAVMEATGKMPKRGGLFGSIGEHMSLAFEERRDMTKMMRKFIENGIIPVKEIRYIVDKCQSENIFGFLSGSGGRGMLAKIEDELTSKESELRRLKEALG